MKKIILCGLMILVILGVAACTPVIQTVVSPEQQQQITELTGQVNELQNNYTELDNKYQTDLSGAQSQIGELNKGLTALQADYDILQQSYNNLLNGQTGLSNPTWAEVKSFITQDTTDMIPYNLQTFACSGYAILIRDHSRQLGFRSAYIQVEFPGAAGHVFNAFQTTDFGLIYIDCTGNEEGTKSDKVAYLKEGKDYGMISIDAVKTEYISCDGSPGDFWQPLTYKTVTNPFNYEYYTEYEARKDFYNDAINAFNAAVALFNSGSSQFTITQMDTWRSNLEVLKLDLGDEFYLSSGVTGNIETYWGDN